MEAFTDILPKVYSGFEGNKCSQMYNFQTILSDNIYCIRQNYVFIIFKESDMVGAQSFTSPRNVATIQMIILLGQT